MAELLPSDKMYGTYRLVSAKVIGITAISQERGKNLSLMGGDGIGGGVKRKRLSDGFIPKGTPVKMPKLATPPPPPPPPPPVRSIGVFDIGQGNCNMLIDQANEPITYFDAGYPLWFFHNSVPNNMRIGNAAYLGPILQNTAGNLTVVLSHWDYDHWRLGAAVLTALNWTVPVQFMGPAALAFWAAVPAANRHYYPAGTPFVNTPSYTLYECQPAVGAPPPSLLNNSGIAMRAITNLPTADLAWHSVMLTGDANFDSIYAIFPNFGPLTGIVAVHHGSNNYGAAMNLPVQAGPYAGQGRVAYSYGVSATTGNHAYGFPNALAVNSYRAAGWGILAMPNNINECGTAEGFQINAGGLAQRGNIRIADNTALAAAAYGYSAFSILGHQLN